MGKNPGPSPGRRRIWAPALGICLALASLAAAAGNLRVAPITLEFQPGEASAALRLYNSGSAPIRVQIRVVEWIQEDGRERTGPTRELVASPPIVEIPPGREQLVRIIRPVALPASRELAYRLLVNELPDESGERTGLRFLLHYSIPVFVAPSAPTAPAVQQDPARLRAQLGPVADGRASLVVENHAPRRVKLSRLVLETPSGERTELVAGLLGYALAGQRMRWSIPMPRSMRPGDTLKARLDDAPEERTLPLDGIGH